MNQSYWVWLIHHFVFMYAQLIWNDAINFNIYRTYKMFTMCWLERAWMSRVSNFVINSTCVLSTKLRKWFYTHPNEMFHFLRSNKLPFLTPEMLMKHFWCLYDVRVVWKLREYANFLSRNAVKNSKKVVKMPVTENLCENNYQRSCFDRMTVSRWEDRGCLSCSKILSKWVYLFPILHVFWQWTRWTFVAPFSWIVSS